MTLLIEVKELRTHFQLDEGTVKAVDGATFDIHRGQTLGIVGESGCGKSMTARSILRIVGRPGQIVGGQILYHRRTNQGSRPTSPAPRRLPLPEGAVGDFRSRGPILRPPGPPERAVAADEAAHDQASDTEEVVDLARLDPFGKEIRSIRGAEIAMIFQEPMTSFSPIHTIGNQIVESIVLHRSANKNEARVLAIDALRRVGMSRPEQRIDQYPHELSGGMRQRAMIAMAMCCNPQLLLADEPTTALDVTTQAQILELMRDLQQDTGASVVMITHDLGVIAEIAQSVVVMYLGRVVEVSDVRSLFRDPKHPYTRALLQSIPRIGRGARARLQPVTGMVPNPYNRPTGCPFHPRCPAAMPGVCDRVVPEPIQLGDGREVACHLYGPGV